MNTIIESKRARRLIYVDASGTHNNTSFKISLYDKENNLTSVLQLNEIANNSEAEQYAIFQAIFYIKKNNYCRCHILCDNKSAVDSKIIQFLAKEYAIGISWIPREANIIADRIAKLEPTLKDTEWNLLKLFVELVKNQCHNQKETTQEKTKEIVALKEQIEKLKTKVANQAKNINALKKK